MMEILQSLHWLKVILLIGIKLCPDKNDHVGLLSIVTPVLHQFFAVYMY